MENIKTFENYKYLDCNVKKKVIINNIVAKANDDFHDYS